LAAACVLACGCGSNGEKIAVSGQVTFDGKPIASGEIVFEPIDSGGRPAVGTIVDGSYHLPEAFGAQPGKYRVRITADRPTGARGNNPYAPDAVPTEQYIPPKYNAATTLEAVIASDRAEHDFDLDGHKR
jgi:hypothetical protein